MGSGEVLEGVISECWGIGENSVFLLVGNFLFVFGFVFFVELFGFVVWGYISYSIIV